MFKHRSLSLPWVFTYSLLNNAGAACIWPLVTMYMHQDLHQTLTTSGWALLLMSVFMLLGNYLGGYLFDRWSPYASSLWFTGLSLASIIALMFWHGWPAFALLLLPLGLGDGVNLTLTNSYATLIPKHSERYIFNIMYIGLNIGVVIGTAMVGYLLQRGVLILFIVTASFYLALFLMALFRFNVNLHRQEVAIKTESDSAAPQHILWLMASICFMVFCIYLSYSIWESVMSVHMTGLGMSFEQYSWIWVVNGTMIVFGQAVVNHFFDRISIVVEVLLGALIFGTSYFLLIPAQHYPMFITSIVILTFGEMMALPVIPAWIDQFATNGTRGRYQAYFTVFMNGGRAVGPLFDGLLVEQVGYSFLFGFSGCLMLLAIVLVFLAVTHRKLVQN